MTRRTLSKVWVDTYLNSQKQDPTPNLRVDGPVSYKTQTRKENVRPLPEAMVGALDEYKDKDLEEDDQRLSGPMVAALTTFLAEYLLDETSTTTPEPLTPGLNAGTTFVVKVVKPYDNRGKVREIWTIEDVASMEVTDLHVPVALLSSHTHPDAMMNRGVIPILERDTRGERLVNYRFSLAYPADGRKTRLYEWWWYVSNPRCDVGAAAFTS